MDQIFALNMPLIYKPKSHIYIYIYIYTCVCGSFNKFPDFFVQAFKIVVDS